MHAQDVWQNIHGHMQEQMGRQHDAVLNVSLLDGNGRVPRDSGSLAIVYYFSMIPSGQWYGGNGAMKDLEYMRREG